MMELSNVANKSLKKIKGNIPELTRPARELKTKMREGKMRAKKRKAPGRETIHKPRPAKYHNWLTPLCWTQVTIIAKQVSWRMNASAITDVLKKRDPIIFSKISQ